MKYEQVQTKSHDLFKYITHRSLHLSITGDTVDCGMRRIQ